MLTFILKILWWIAVGSMDWKLMSLSELGQGYLRDKKQERQKQLDYERSMSEFYSRSNETIYDFLSRSNKNMY